MKLQALRLFLRIMELGSLAAAAKSLNMSQSAASRLLSGLEHGTGLRLFHRDRMRLVPTTEGTSFFAEVRRVLVAIDDLPVTEDTPLNPLSPYAESKAAADDLCAEYQRDHGLAVLRLRAFNQLGPGQDPRFVVPSICKQIADAEMSGDAVCRLHLGNLDTRRDFLDVRDVVQAYRLLIDRGDPAQTYLAGQGRSESIRELVDIAVSFARLPVEVVSDVTRVREGEQPDLYAEPRALKELGWAPRIPIEQSISDTLDYWRDRAHMEVG